MNHTVIKLLVQYFCFALYLLLKHLGQNATCLYDSTKKKKKKRQGMNWNSISQPPQLIRSWELCMQPFKCYTTAVCHHSYPNDLNISTPLTPRYFFRKIQNFYLSSIHNLHHPHWCSFPLTHPTFHQQLLFSLSAHVLPSSIFWWSFKRPCWEPLVILIFLQFSYFISSFYNLVGQ